LLEKQILKTDDHVNSLNARIDTLEATNAAQADQISQLMAALSIVAKVSDPCVFPFLRTSFPGRISMAVSKHQVVLMYTATGTN